MGLRRDAHLVGRGILDTPPKKKIVILSERSESKDLGTDLTAAVIQMRRSLSSISFRSG